MTMNPTTHQRWKTRKTAQKIADANNDPDDETADYYLVEEVNGYFVIVVTSGDREPELFQSGWRHDL